MTHVSTSSKTPGATVMVEVTHLNPSQQPRAPEQSAFRPTHGAGGGGGGEVVAAEGGGGPGGLGGGCGGLGGLGERMRATTGGGGGGDGCGGGDGLRNRPTELPPPSKSSAPPALASCRGISVTANQTPSTSVEKSSRRRHPRLEQLHHVCAYRVSDALFRCSSSSSGTTVTTGTSFASVGTDWCWAERSLRSDANVSCMPPSSFISYRLGKSLNARAQADDCLARDVRGREGACRICWTLGR